MKTDGPDDRDAADRDSAPAAMRDTDYTVGPVASALDILLEFENGPATMRVSDLARRVKVTRNKAFRLVKTLESRGFLQRVGEQYQVGVRLLALGRLATQPIEELRSAVAADMAGLARQTGETVYVLVPDGPEAVCVAVIESAHYLRISVQVGQRRPLHAGAGQKMLLAGLEEARLRQVLAREAVTFTSHTITDVESLRKHLAEIRQRGYSVSAGEVDPDAGAVAAPIYDHSQQMVATIVVGGSMSRLTSDPETEWAGIVTDAAARISARLGYIARDSEKPPLRDPALADGA